jgi:NADH-quinone oxidoreductase subunit C
MTNSKLTNEDVFAKLKDTFGDKIGEFTAPFDLLTIEVPSADAHSIIDWLKKEATLNINYLTVLGAVHYPEDKGRELAIVYHIHSLVNNFRIRIKAFISTDKPSIATITDIYAGANWMERETFDFYGVIFEGHPNLTRILNEESMDYFPMRKEYQLEDATREDKDDRYFGR